MSKPRMQHCFNCGEELGVYDKPPYAHDACGKPECQREELTAYQAEDEEAQIRAREDDYNRYR